MNKAFIGMLAIIAALALASCSSSGGGGYGSSSHPTTQPGTPSQSSPNNSMGPGM